MYKDEEGKPLPLEPRVVVMPGQPVPAVAVRQIAPDMKIVSATASARRKDNSKFPEFLRKVHSEVMVTPEGQRAKAREQVELDFQVAKAEQGEAVEVPDRHRRAIPIDSHPVAPDKSKSENP